MNRHAWINQAWLWSPEHSMYEANLEVALLQMEDKFGRWASNASGREKSVGILGCRC